MEDLAFSIVCPYCKQKLKCPAQLVGTKRSCPSCHKQFFIPLPEAVPVDEADVSSEDYLQNSAWQFTERAKEIDDAVVRQAAVPAIDEKAGLRPLLICRATLKNCSVAQELFLSFPSKVFSIRGEPVPARVRVDDEEPTKLSILTSETGNACFFENESALIARLQDAGRVLVEVTLMKLGTQVFEFDIRGFAALHRRLLLGAVDATLQELRGFNQNIVDHVFRIGPRNLEALIEVLCGSKLLHQNHTDEARRKNLALFAAAQAFADSHHVGEIYGFVENGRVNNPFSIEVYESMSQATRNKIGKLTIGE